MAEVTPAIVKALREETGLGMMDCKKALDETKGDIEAARDLLRKKGLATAEKKAGRATGQGLIVIEKTADGKSAAMVEVQCETDFCARNDVFQGMVNALAKMAIAGPDGDIASNANIEKEVQAALAKIGENMKYSRGRKISAAKVGTYVHFNGKVGVVIGFDGVLDDALIADLCMHVAFSNPMGIRPEDIPADLVAKEKQIAMEKAVEQNKPANIAEKMAEGSIRKFMEANALNEQAFVKDDKKKIKDLLGKVTITSFARFAIGG